MFATAAASAPAGTGGLPTSPDLLYHAEMLGRLLLAGACGALIGWQRERKDKAAGLRTHMLLALGSCTFTLAGLGMGGEDILRLVQGALMGTGFICGGVIFRQGPTVRGLTTAVGLWILSAIGLACGAGEYFLAILGTIMAFAVMAGFYRVEERIDTEAGVPPHHGGPPGDTGGAEA